MYKSDESDGMAVFLTAPADWRARMITPGIRLEAPGAVESSKADLTVEFYRIESRSPEPWSGTSQESLAARVEAAMETYGAIDVLEAGTVTIGDVEGRYGIFTIRCHDAPGEGGNLVQHWVRDDFNIRVRYGSCDRAAFEAYRADAEEIAASIEFGPWEPNFSDDGTPWQIFDSPMITMSSSGRYYQDSAVFAEMPPGWSGVPVALAFASGPEDPGHLVVDFSPVSGEVKLRVHVQGLPLRSHSREEFLGTAESLYVNELFADFDRSEPEAAHFSRLSILGMDRFLGWRGPGGLFRQVYSGTAVDGSELRVETYTSGGFTVVYHVFVVGDPQGLDAAREEIHGLLETLSIRGMGSESPIP